MNNGLFTYLAALLLFGSNGIIAAAIALPSSDIVLLRTFLGALTLAAILFITKRHNLQAPSRPREAAALIVSGAALGASWIFLFRAYQTIGVGISSLLYYCGPIIVMALSPLIFGEKLTGSKIAGFIAVACGAFLIAAQGLGGNMPIAGIACGIVSAFCYALMVIASKGAPHIEGLENSTLQVSAAFVTALILTLFTQGAPSFLSPSIAAGIEDRYRSNGASLLPNVTPAFDWVRLAQRIPVRIVIDRIPAEAMGTCSVLYIDGQAEPRMESGRPRLMNDR